MSDKGIKTLFRDNRVIKQRRVIWVKGWILVSLPDFGKADFMLRQRDNRPAEWLEFE